MLRSLFLTIQCFASPSWGVVRLCPHRSWEVNIVLYAWEVSNISCHSSLLAADLSRPLSRPWELLLYQANFCFSPLIYWKLSCPYTIESQDSICWDSLEMWVWKKKMCEKGVPYSLDFGKFPWLGGKENKLMV